MSIFEKKKKETKCCCGSNEMSGPNTVGAYVKILGSGCKKCNELEANTVAALKELGIDTAVEHVRDFMQIAGYGVMSTPALVVDGKVVAFGKVLGKDEIAAILRKVR